MGTTKASWSAQNCVVCARVPRAPSNDSGVAKSTLPNCARAAAAANNSSRASRI
jgi:hypothetical protein